MVPSLAWFRLLALMAACWPLLAGGCAPVGGVDTTYGQRRGPTGGTSVAGTGLLAGLFEQAGFQVSSEPVLSARVDDYDVIVWAPDSFKPPNSEETRWLNNWLSQRERTLVYIGRDYDAASAYWRQVLPEVPPGQRLEAARRLALAQADDSSRRADIPARFDGAWFKLRGGHPRRKVSQLSGPWSLGIDAARCDLEIGARLYPITLAPSEMLYPASPRNPPWSPRETLDEMVVETEDATEERADPEDESKLLNPPLGAKPTVLLAGDGLPLVGMTVVSDWNSSRVIMVSNGSFLLNYPLARAEHRKLAARLVNACNGQKAFFLESGPEGAQIAWGAQANETTTIYDWLVRWPVGFMLVHVLAAGIVACAWLFPIFGRPKELLAHGVSDFRQHVAALGELLHRTDDDRFAQSQIDQYREAAAASRATGGRAPRSAKSPPNRSPREGPPP